MPGVAHELDSLVAALLSNVELGLSTAEPDSRGLAQLQELHRIAKRARTLTGQLAELDRSASASSSEPVNPSAKLRLLIVDDEPQVRRVLTVALESAGFDVVSAAAGNTALDLFDSDPHGFDLVLTDLTMPGLDGHELFDALTARDPELPVILTSGYPDPLRTACYPDGRPALFLEKPYRLGHLLAKVHEQLGRRSA